MNKNLAGKSNLPVFKFDLSVASHSEEVLDLLPVGVLILAANRDNRLKIKDFAYSFINKAAKGFLNEIYNSEFPCDTQFSDEPLFFSKSYLKIFTKIIEKNISHKDEISFVVNNRKRTLLIDASKNEDYVVLAFSEISNNPSVSKKNDRAKNLQAGDEQTQELIQRTLPENKVIKGLKEDVKKLERLNDSLENEISGKAQEILDLKTQVLRINEELNHFVYTASHDLKSPISNIEGLLYALVLDLNEKNEDAKDIIGLLNLSLNKFLTTLNDLSEIAVVQKDSEDESNIVLSGLFDDIKISIQEEILKYRASVEGDFSEAPVIHFSRKNLRSILYNLISNGLKYSSPQRLPEVKVKSYKTDKYFVLMVSDNGLGIKAEDRDKIFTVFKRVYTHVAGSGIGLYIIKRIVENCGGKIELQTEVNKGATFKVFLPQPKA